MFAFSLMARLVVPLPPNKAYPVNFTSIAKAQLGISFTNGDSVQKFQVLISVLQPLFRTQSSCQMPIFFIPSRKPLGITSNVASGSGHDSDINTAVGISSRCRPVG